MTGNQFPRAEDPRCIEMIRAWWELHPEDNPDRALDSTLDVHLVARQGDERGGLRRQTDAYRARLYDRINGRSYPGGMGDPHYGCCTECGARRTLVRELVRGGVIYRWLRCSRCGHEARPAVFG